MQAEHRAFGNIGSILKIFKNEDKIQNETDMLTLVSIKIWDAHFFPHSNATCLYFLSCYSMQFLSHAYFCLFFLMNSEPALL